jgi:serine O-acetyltransferase
MSSRTRLGEDIQAVLERDPAARNWLEVLFTSPGVRALFWHRVSNRLWRANWKLLARLIAYRSRRATGIEIHPGATIGRRLVIDHGMGVVVGETAVIGEDCLIYHGVTLGGKKPGDRQHFEGRRHPEVGSDVTIGAGACVLGDVVVGDGARVAAHAVVVNDVPAGALAVGIPAKNLAGKA